MTTEQTIKQLKKVADEVRACAKCPLAQTRINPVVGEGNPEADIMFIGEGPGKNEDEQGRPFVGAAGKYLEELLSMINLTREQVYIGNVVKCRPPFNRDPLPQEIESCKPFLDTQIKILKPKLIVTLGRFSLNLFIPGKTISTVHGKPMRRDGRVYYPVYHPAAALYRNEMKIDIEKDFHKIPSVLQAIEKLPPPEKREQEKLHTENTSKDHLPKSIHKQARLNF